MIAPLLEFDHALCDASFYVTVASGVMQATSTSSISGTPTALDERKKRRALLLLAYLQEEAGSIVETAMRSCERRHSDDATATPTAAKTGRTFSVAAAGVVGHLAGELLLLISSANTSHGDAYSDQRQVAQTVLTTVTLIALEALSQCFIRTNSSEVAAATTPKDAQQVTIDWVVSFAAKHLFPMVASSGSEALSATAASCLAEIEETFPDLSLFSPPLASSPMALQHHQGTSLSVVGCLSADVATLRLCTTSLCDAANYFSLVVAVEQLRRRHNDSTHHTTKSRGAAAARGKTAAAAKKNVADNDNDISPLRKFGDAALLKDATEALMAAAPPLFAAHTAAVVDVPTLHLLCQAALSIREMLKETSEVEGLLNAILRCFSHAPSLDGLDDEDEDEDEEEDRSGRFSGSGSARRKSSSVKKKKPVKSKRESISRISAAIAPSSVGLLKFQHSLPQEKCRFEVFAPIAAGSSKRCGMLVPHAALLMFHLAAAIRLPPLFIPMDEQPPNPLPPNYYFALGKHGKGLYLDTHKSRSSKHKRNSDADARVEEADDLLAPLTAEFAGLQKSIARGVSSPILDAADSATALHFTFPPLPGSPAVNVICRTSLDPSYFLPSPPNDCIGSLAAPAFLAGALTPRLLTLKIRIAARELLRNPVEEFFGKEGALSPVFSFLRLLREKAWNRGGVQTAVGEALADIVFAFGGALLSQGSVLVSVASLLSSCSSVFVESVLSVLVHRERSLDDGACGVEATSFTITSAIAEQSVRLLPHHGASVIGVNSLTARGKQHLLKLSDKLLSHVVLYVVSNTTSDRLLHFAPLFEKAFCGDDSETKLLLMEHLTARVSEVANTWYAGSLFIRCIRAFLVSEISSCVDDLDDNTEAMMMGDVTAALDPEKGGADSKLSMKLIVTQSLLTAMSGHFSDPAIAQHIIMLQSILTHLPLRAIAYLVEAIDGAGAERIMQTCEDRTEGRTIPLDPTPNVRVMLLPQDSQQRQRKQEERAEKEEKEGASATIPSAGVVSSGDEADEEESFSSLPLRLSIQVLPPVAEGKEEGEEQVGRGTTLIGATLKVYGLCDTSCLASGFTRTATLPCGSFSFNKSYGPGQNLGEKIGQFALPLLEVEMTNEEEEEEGEREGRKDTFSFELTAHVQVPQPLILSFRLLTPSSAVSGDPQVLPGRIVVGFQRYIVSPSLISSETKQSQADTEEVEENPLLMPGPEADEMRKNLWLQFFRCAANQQQKQLSLRKSVASDIQVVLQEGWDWGRVSYCSIHGVKGSPLQSTAFMIAPTSKWERLIKPALQRHLVFRPKDDIIEGKSQNGNDDDEDGGGVEEEEEEAFFARGVLLVRPTGLLVIDVQRDGAEQIIMHCSSPDWSTIAMFENFIKSKLES